MERLWNVPDNRIIHNTVYLLVYLVLSMKHKNTLIVQFWKEWSLKTKVIWALN
jgi:hypothetical protein